MDTFYKAVGMDGTDFRTGEVDYASISGTGEWLPELPGGACCTNRVYHASTSATGTLIGGSWPCRLFLVEGEPVSEEDNKRGFRTLRVLEELPAWQALGPQGELVVDLIEKAKTVTQPQVMALRAAWNVTRNTAWNAALDAAWHAAWDSARIAAWDAAGYAARGTIWTGGRSADGYDIWGIAGSIAGCAARALMVKDLINEEDFTLLYGPWASVME